MRHIDLLEIYEEAFTHVRRQAPVGQGGFHIGALASDTFPACLSYGTARFVAADTLYVYDCGSEPMRHVQAEIRALVATQPARHLDVLALSHLDRDHICGTPHLLHKTKGFAGVDTVLLPYIDDAERLIAVGKAVTDGGRIPRFFSAMAVDPITTLSGLGARRIILVRPEDDDGGGEAVDLAPAPDGPGSDDAWQTYRGERRLSWRPKPARLDRPWRFETVLRTPRMQVVEASNVMLIGATDDWSIHWKLRPYTRAAKTSEIAAFKAAVEKIFGWGVGTFDLKAASPKVRRQMVTTKRTKLAKAYAQAFKDKNLTSMSLYSGPAEPDTLDAMSIEHGLGAHELTKVGWLGTGDAHLREASERKALEMGFAVDLPVTSTFVFPHHGSIENTDPDALVSEADNWVAAADPIHKWAHPHWSLQKAVSDLGATFRHVRAHKETAFDEAYVLQPVPRAGPDLPG